MTAHTLAADTSVYCKVEGLKLLQFRTEAAFWKGGEMSSRA